MDKGIVSTSPAHRAVGAGAGGRAELAFAARDERLLGLIASLPFIALGGVMIRQYRRLPSPPKAAPPAMARPTLK
ncbi:MAG: hypothetical protein ACYC7F_07385 [Gemmatimonadaceae bacterium]